jgi:hypothetical protein
MKPFGKNQFLFLGCFTGLILLGGCEKAEPEVCGLLEIRNSIVKMIANDDNNPLVNYAAKNSNAVAAMVGETKVEAEKLRILENAKRNAVYTLNDTILTKLRDRVTHSVTCIGFLDVKVADATAQKEVEFKVKQSTDGKMLVSVNPFLF